MISSYEITRYNEKYHLSIWCKRQRILQIILKEFFFINSLIWISLLWAALISSITSRLWCEIQTFIFIHHKKRRFVIAIKPTKQYILYELFQVVSKRSGIYHSTSTNWRTHSTDLKSLVSTRALSCNEWYRQSKRKCFKFYVNDLVYTILLVLIHEHKTWEYHGSGIFTFDDDWHFAIWWASSFLKKRQ